MPETMGRDPVELMLRGHYNGLTHWVAVDEQLTDTAVDAAMTRRRRRSAATRAATGVAAAVVTVAAWGLTSQGWLGATPQRVVPAEPVGHTVVFKIEPSGGNVEDRTSAPAVDCQFRGGPSPYAVTPGTHRCGATADSAFACAKSRIDSNELLCVTDPFNRQFRLVSAVNISDTPKPANPVPLGIQLDDGSRWVAWTGGTSDVANPPAGLIQSYVCISGNAHCRTGVAALLSPFSPETGPEINPDTPQWTITLATAASFDAKPTLERHAVAAAWYVATDGQ